MSAVIHHGDCLEVMPTLALSSVDSIVTDPPYGLSFMGKAWDRGVPGALFWSQALRVIRPGGYMLAFGGTRTVHRLACAIEDAGWEIHDQIVWLYGSGFPKHRSKLKPAHEPIIVARRPAATATPLNIDACRLGEAYETRGGAGELWSHRRDAGKEPAAVLPAHELGRWPANVCIDEEAAALLDEQSGTLTSGANPQRRKSDKFRDVYGAFDGQEQCEPARGIDVGGASRFYYCAKANRTERDAGVTSERKPLLWSSGTQSPGTFQSEGTDKTARNNHPTVKPLDLMRWLARLVTPANGVVLDPFAGSGSTGCAAVLEGLSFVGIEREAAYVDIARARIAHHAERAA